MNDNTDGNREIPRVRGMFGDASSAGKKIRGTFLLPGELLDELRDASYWARQSLARIAERALTAELTRLRDEHNGGKQFGRRPAA